MDFATDQKFDTAVHGEEFEELFSVLNSLGPSVFRKYDERREGPVGAFSVSAYEAVTLGVTKHLDAWSSLSDPDRAERLRECVKSLWSDKEFIRSSGAGVRATQRVPKMGAIGRRIFEP
jgi:hypothetical protein